VQLDALSPKFQANIWSGKFTSFKNKRDQIKSSIGVMSEACMLSKLQALATETTSHSEVCRTFSY